MNGWNLLLFIHIIILSKLVFLYLFYINIAQVI